MDSWVIQAEDVVGEQRTDPSLAWLVPQQGFWSDQEVGSFHSGFTFLCICFGVFLGADWQFLQ